jgi:UDP-glucose 4-epimerase
LVFHLAAIHFIPACASDPVGTLETNVIGTQNLIDACSTVDTNPRIIFTSTADVYRPTSDALHEDAMIGPASVYGVSKLAAEGLLRQAERDGLCELVVCRLFNLFGPGETNPHVIPEIIRQLRLGDVLQLGNTTPRRDFVYTADAAVVLESLAVAAPSGSCVNVGSGTAYSVDDLVQEIASILDRSITIRSDASRWRKSDRPLLQCDNRLLRELVPDALPTSLRQGLVELLVSEGLVNGEHVLLERQGIR